MSEEPGAGLASVGVEALGWTKCWPNETFSRAVHELKKECRYKEKGKKTWESGRSAIVR